MGIKKYKNDLIIIFSFILVLFFCARYLVEPFRIPTTSMEPNIAKGDFIITNKFIYGQKLPNVNNLLFKVEKIKRGDVVVFKNRKDKNKQYVKRVIGLPGETIQIKNKVVYVNNGALPHDIYKIVDNDYAIMKENGTYILLMANNYKNLNYKKIKIPKNQYFVLGDNRDNSFDSRHFGAIDEHDIQGKVISVWFTINWDSNFLAVNERLFKVL